MNNMLKEFKELLFDNTLFEVQNQALGNKLQLERVVENHSRIYKGVLIDPRKHGNSLF
jgi:hypothetical protein